MYPGRLICVSAGYRITADCREIKVRAGSFIAAVSSSLPETWVLDDSCLSRASLIVVDWRSRREDLTQAAPDRLHKEIIADLSDELPGRRRRARPEDIIIYKSVGIGLQDIALAGYAYFKLSQA